MADPRVAGALAWLKKHSSKAVRDGMARYAIPNEHALGVRMGDIQKLAKQLGRDHALALALWKTGVYEARMLTRLCRRAGARDAGTDGRAGARLRQLGDLRHAVLRAVGAHPAGLREDPQVGRPPR